MADRAPDIDSAATEVLRGGVRVLSIEEDLPLVEISPGVSARHLVASRLMLRLVQVENASFELGGEGLAEHVLLVLDGQMQVTDSAGRRSLTVGDVVVLPPSTRSQIASASGRSRCVVVDSPPDVELVRELFHLDHSDHGFD